MSSPVLYPVDCESSSNHHSLASLAAHYGRYDRYYSQSVYPSIDAWNFSAQGIAQAISGERLLNPSLDLSNPCNLNCPYCFIEEKGSLRKARRPNELTFSETCEVIDDFWRGGARTINLVGAGEPTIDPSFKEIIAHIHNLKIKSLVFTNGTRIAEEPGLAEWLLRHDVSVVLKYNSESTGIQDTLVASKGYTQKRNAALARLLEAGFANCYPTRLGFDVLALESVAKELPYIYFMARLLNIVPLIADFIPTGRTQDGLLQRDGLVILAARKEDTNRASHLFEPLSDTSAISLMRELNRIDQKFGIESPVGTSGYYGGGRCSQILGVYVDITGAIWPCVARIQKFETWISRKPLGYLRAGDVPSVCWRTHPYMALLRENYNGGCPYKRPIITPKVVQ